MATPSTTALSFLPAETLAAMIRRRELSPVELMEATLARIDAVNPTLNAFIQIDPERGMATARAQTDRIARGEDLVQDQTTSSVIARRGTWSQA
jgi:Asp-tRNA(Asn)/Glu-tRNA(Gln) amidotransferase A subunit family amidase